MIFVKIRKHRKKKMRSQCKSGSTLFEYEIPIGVNMNVLCLRLLHICIFKGILLQLLKRNQSSVCNSLFFLSFHFGQTEYCISFNSVKDEMKLYFIYCWIGSNCCFSKHFIALRHNQSCSFSPSLSLTVNNFLSTQFYLPFFFHWHKACFSPLAISPTNHLTSFPFCMSLGTTS